MEDVSQNLDLISDEAQQAANSIIIVGEMNLITDTIDSQLISISEPIDGQLITLSEPIDSQLISISEANGNELVTISDPNVVFQTVVLETTEMEEPEPKSPPSCKICDKTFKRSKGYTKHMRKIHKTYTRNKEKPTEKDLTCNICGKTFTTRGGLNTHVKCVHNPDGVPPTYKCNHCSYQTLRKSTFKAHVLRNHLMPKPEKKVDENREFPCETCGKVFKARMNLYTHVNNVHFPRRVYKCDKCDFKSNTKCSYMRHVVRKHMATNPDKPFRCSVCDTSFKIKAYMRRHELNVHKIQHTSEVHKKKCPLCPFTSKRMYRAEILDHFRNTHNIPLTTEKHVFNDLESFNKWKRGVEEQTNSYYKGETSATRSKWHNCNRSGNYDKSKGSLDVNGYYTTIKLNAFCPAAIHMKVLPTGQLEAEYWPVHVGHSTCDEKRKTFINSTSIEVSKVELRKESAVVKRSRRPTVNFQGSRPAINTISAEHGVEILTLKNVDLIVNTAKTTTNNKEVVVVTTTEKNTTYETLVDEALNQIRDCNTDDETIVNETLNGEKLDEKTLENTSNNETVAHRKEVNSVGKSWHKTYKCGYCSFQTSNRRHCRQHMRQHAPESNSCNYCDKEFLHRAVLMRHIQAEHSQKNYACSHCDFKTTSRLSLKSHSYLHDPFRQTFTCQFCDETFGHKRTLKRHIDVDHLDKKEFACAHCSHKTTRKVSLEKHCLARHNAARPSNYRPFQCSQCDAAFKRREMLYAHERLKHNITHSQVQPDLPYKCSQCDAAFERRSTVNAHEKRVHQNVKTVYCKKCPLCTFVSTRYTRLEMHTHFKKAHSIALTIEKYVFNDLTSFREWKEDLQKATGLVYNGGQGMKSKFYKCSHCKQTIERVEDKDGDKPPSIRKTLAFCPSEIELEQFGNGQLLVKYWPVHVGHAIQTQKEVNALSKSNIKAYSVIKRNINERLARYLNGTVSDENVILDNDESVAEKTADKNVTEETLVNDEIAGETSTENDQIVIDNVSKKIETRTEESSNPNDEIEMTIETVSDKNSSSSQKPVEEMFDVSWIENLESNSETSMLQVKLTNVLSDDFPALQKDDYVFIYMSNAQKDRITDIENKTIFIDKAYDIKVDLHVFSLLVIDESKNGYPVAFLFTNRRDEGVLRVLFMKIEEHLGRLTPGVFMSDIEDTVYSTWCSVMGPAKSHVYSTLHVLRAWKKNLDKIPSKDNREHVFSILRSLLCELDEVIFHELLDEIVSTSMFENEAYFKYFEDNFLVNMRYKQWAHCFFSDPEFSLESYGRVLKQCFLIGMGTENLSEVLRLILETFTNKLQDWSNESVMRTDRKVMRIKNRHKNSLVISRTNVRQVSDCTWVVMSFAATRREFSVVKKVASCSACDLVCSKCDSCVHEYVCSCWDGAMRDNMCVHIHLVVRSFFKSVENHGGNETEVELVEEEDDSDEEEEDEEVGKEIVIHCGDLPNAADDDDSSGYEYFPDESSTDNDNEEAPVGNKLRKLKSVTSGITKSKNVNSVNDVMLVDINKDESSVPSTIRKKRSRSEDVISSENAVNEILIELDNSPPSNSKDENKRRKVISSDDEDGIIIDDGLGCGVVSDEVLIEVDEEQPPKFDGEVKSTSKDVSDTNEELFGDEVELPFEQDRTKSQVPLKISRLQSKELILQNLLRTEGKKSDVEVIPDKLLFDVTKSMSQIPLKTSKVESKKRTPEYVIDDEVLLEVDRTMLQSPVNIPNLRSVKRTPRNVSRAEDKKSDSGTIPDKLSNEMEKTKLQSQVNIRNLRSIKRTPRNVSKTEDKKSDNKTIPDRGSNELDKIKLQEPQKISKVKSKKSTPNVSSAEDKKSDDETISNEEDKTESEAPPKLDKKMQTFVEFCQKNATNKEQSELNFIEKMMEEFMSAGDSSLQF